MENSRRIVAALVALSLLALGLRLSGAGHMLPCLAEPDAHVVEQVAMHRAPSAEPYYDSKAYGKYPHLLSRLLWLWPADDEPPPGPVGARSGADPAALEAELSERLAAVAAPYVRGRVLVALLSTLLVPATWLLARRFLGGGAALLAAGFAATSLLHVSFSWQARPHGPLASLTTLALLGLFALRRRPTAGRYLLAGTLVALAVGCLHNGVLVLPAVLAAHLLAERRDGALRHHARLLVPLVPVALAVLAFYPFLLAEGGRAGAEARGGAVVQAGHRFDLAQLDGTGFARMLRDLFWHDPVLLGLAAAGLVLALAAAARGRGAAPGETAPGAEDERRARRRDLAVVLACALPYFLVLGLFAKTYERFQLPLVPFYALLAAYAVRAVVPRRWLLVAGLLALAAPAYGAVRLAALARAPDTAELAARWIAEHVDPAERILVQPDVSFPLVQRTEGLPAELDADTSRRRPWLHHLRTHGVAEGVPAWDVVTIPWREYQATGRVQLRGKDDPRAGPALRELLRALDGDWAVLEVRPGDAPLRGVPEAVLASGARVARISPFGERAGEPGGIDAGERPLLTRGHEDERLILRAWRARHWGPAYDVVRLR